MTRYKQLEKEHYNKKAKRIIEKGYDAFAWESGRSARKGFGILSRTHFEFAENIIKRIILTKGKQDVKILDYGCGTGVHSVFPAKQGAKVYGIDISEEALAIARERARYQHVERETEFHVMDGETLSFPENFFDIVFNCDTLSCVNQKKAFPEILRVLKPEGFFVSVDTLGHNPILNFNRRLYVMRGLRTKQTFQHILTMQDIEEISRYFGVIEKMFFHLTTLLTVPLYRVSEFFSHSEEKPFIGFIRKTLEKADTVLFTFPFFQRYAFKAVLLCSKPKKKNH